MLVWATSEQAKSSQRIVLFDKRAPPSFIVEIPFVRHRIKPGMTGWAQVNGMRGETDTPDKIESRVQYDIYYADNWSLGLDLKILLMTVAICLTGRNAY